MLSYTARVDNLSGRAVTTSTIRAMHDQVRLAKQDWAWIELATWIVRGVPSKAYLAEAKRLFDAIHALIWETEYFSYRRDSHQVEVVTSPWHVISRRAGDCDDWSVFYASLVGAVGFPYRFKTVNADPTRPSQPSHVYTQVLVPGYGWRSADLTVERAVFGWEPTGYPFELWPEPEYR